MALEPTTVTLRAESPRYQDWLRVFGSASVRVKSPIALRGRDPAGVECDFYLVDLAALTPEQMERVVLFIAERFEIPVDTVRATLPDHGLPLVAADCSVTFDARLVL